MVLNWSRFPEVLRRPLSAAARASLAGYGVEDGERVVEGFNVVGADVVDTLLSLPNLARAVAAVPLVLVVL